MKRFSSSTVVAEQIENAILAVYRQRQRRSVKIVRDCCAAVILCILRHGGNRQSRFIVTGRNIRTLAEKFTRVTLAAASVFLQRRLCNETGKLCYVRRNTFRRKFFRIRSRNTLDRIYCANRGDDVMLFITFRYEEFVRR